MTITVNLGSILGFIFIILFVVFITAAVLGERFNDKTIHMIAQVNMLRLWTKHCVTNLSDPNKEKLRNELVDKVFENPNYEIARDWYNFMFGSYGCKK